MSQKNLLVRALAEKAGITQKQVRAVLDSLQAIACSEARDESGFTLPGICRIDIIRRKARKMKNPRTGGMMTIAEHNVPRVRLLKRTRDGIVPPVKNLVTYETAEEVAKKLEDFSHAISFRCKKCGQEFEVAASAAGLTTTCGVCGASILIPDASEPGTMHGAPLAAPIKVEIPAAIPESAPAAATPAPAAPAAAAPAAAAPAAVAPAAVTPAAAPAAVAPAAVTPAPAPVSPAAIPVPEPAPAAIPVPEAASAAPAKTQHILPDGTLAAPAAKSAAISPITPIIVPKPAPAPEPEPAPAVAAAPAPSKTQALPDKVVPVSAIGTMKPEELKGRTIRIDFSALGFDKPAATAAKKPAAAPAPAPAKPGEKRAISFFCKNCHQEIEAEADMAGSGAECPSCGAIIEVPFFSEPGTIHADDAKEESKDEQKNRTIRLDFLNDM